MSGGTSINKYPYAEDHDIPRRHARARDERSGAKRAKHARKYRRSLRPPAGHRDLPHAGLHPISSVPIRRSLSYRMICLRAWMRPAVRRVLVDPRKAAPVLGVRTLHTYVPLRCVPNGSVGETNTLLTAKVSFFSPTNHNLPLASPARICYDTHKALTISSMFLF